MTPDSSSWHPAVNTTADNHTDFIILRKTPYLGGNTIVSGLAPQLGHAGFFLRPTASRKKPFTEFDLFRHVHILYRRGQGELLYCEAVEPRAAFDHLAHDYHAFQTACWLASFIIDNTIHGVPQPRLFNALLVALTRLAEPRPNHHAVLTGIALLYLDEGGWLDRTAFSSQEQAQCQFLINMAAGGDKPGLTPENWQNLWLWTWNLLLQADCRLHTQPPFQTPP